MVRVALEAAQKKAAVISLMVACIAAASIWAAYWVWHQDQGAVAAQRDLPDVIVHWRCQQGHVFDAPGHYEALPCPTCKNPARILIRYVCPTDGPFDALVMYDSPTRKLTAVRFDSGDWVSVGKIVPCPRCRGELRPRQRGPFDRVPATAGTNVADPQPAAP